MRQRNLASPDRMAALLQKSGGLPNKPNIHIISIAMKTSIMHPEVSVIVPTLDEESYLERTLASIATQNTNTPYELIIADGASTDGGMSIAERYTDVIIQCEEDGIGAGRHCGAKHARGRYLMFIDADTIPPCYYIAWLCDRFTDRDLVAFSASFGFSEQSQSAKLAEKVTNQYLTMRDKVLKPTLPGFNTCVRKDAYLEIGGYRNVSLEDIEFSRRISQIGKTRYFDDVVVITSPRRLDGMGLLGTLYYYTKA
ncbi:MAG: glycosyltransferase [Euryarchaeota archaeon]|nr:glycosyltransferase [Euryarchaeota archaeon]